MSLTNKQIAFVEHYLACWNASEAARRAGYRGKANVSGPRLLANESIQAYIQARLTELKMSADEVLTRLGEKARFDIGPYVYHNKETDEPVVDWDKLVYAGMTHLVKAVYQTQHGTRIEFHDPERALELLGKHHKLFTERHEVEATHTVSDDVLDAITGSLARGYDKDGGE